jgi:hypothetical protein
VIVARAKAANVSRSEYIRIQATGLTRLPIPPVPVELPARIDVQVGRALCNLGQSVPDLVRHCMGGERLLVAGGHLSADDQATLQGKLAIMVRHLERLMALTTHTSPAGQP